MLTNKSYRNEKHFFNSSNDKNVCGNIQDYGYDTEIIKFDKMVFLLFS